MAQISERASISKNRGSLPPGTRIRISLILLCITVALLTHAYHTTYPLTLTETSGYIYQVSLSFWAAMLLGIFALSLLAMSTKSIFVVGLAIWAIYILYNSRQILYFHLDMSDNISVSSWTHALGQIDSLPPLDSSGAIDYSQFPAQHLLTIPIQNLFNTDVMTTLEIGYFIYVSLFAIAVFVFCYNYINPKKPFYIFSGAALFFALVYYPLNNQFVPQFLALIILTFLFTIHHKSGTRWVIMKLTLFTTLVLSHGLFFLFYLLAVLIEPSITAIKWTISPVSGNTKKTYQVLLSQVKNVIPAFRSFPRELKTQYTDRTWMIWILTLISIYLVFLIYRFVQFQRSVFYTLTLRTVDDYSNPYTVLWRITPGPFRDLLPFNLETGTTAEAEGPQSVLLYEFASQELHFILRNGSIIVVLSILLLLLLTHLIQKYRYISPFNVAVFIGSFVYFLFGSLFPLLGHRALQVAFLPLIIAVGAFNRLPKTSRILVVLLLLFSCVFIANIFVNQSIAAGGSTEDQYTTIAGERLVQNTEATIMKPHENSLPLNDNVIPINRVLSEQYQVSDGDIILYAPIVEQSIRHQGYVCNLGENEHNIIYDNTAKGYWIDTERNSINCTSST